MPRLQGGPLTVVWVVAAVINGDWTIVGAYRSEKTARLQCNRYKMAFIEQFTLE